LSALGLKWESVNFARAELAAIQPKTGEVKTVPLIPEALAILKARKPAQAEPEGYVFSVKQGKPISENTWFKWFDEARRAAKLKGLRPHDLRHSIAQRLSDAGIAPAIIGMILGHAFPYTTTARYTAHAKPEQVRKALSEAFGQ
jgi:integrase